MIRVSRVFFYRFLIFFFIRHYFPLVLLSLTIGAGFVYSKAIASPNIDYVECKKHYAIEIPDTELFAGSYVRCQDFNQMQRYLEAGKMEKAKSLLLFVK